MIFGLREGLEPIPGYRLVRFLGRGGSGEVWQAVAPGEVPVALKFIPQDGELAEPELRALEVIRGIRHPHLLDIHFAVFHNRHLIVGMPLCEQSLDDRLRECREQGHEALPLPELLRYVDDLARAVDYLNEPRHPSADGTLVGIQHRDIKPQNIFLVGDSVRLADFGLAKVVNAASAEHSTGLSPYYAAPELIVGRVSRRTDQYSFAACYYHLRTGQKLFSGPMADVMDAHLRVVPDLLSLADREREVVARALSKDPELRWPDCRRFAAALAGAFAGKVSRFDPPDPGLTPHPKHEGSTTIPAWAAPRHVEVAGNPRGLGQAVDPAPSPRVSPSSIRPAAAPSVREGRRVDPGRIALASVGLALASTVLVLVNWTPTRTSPTVATVEKKTDRPAITDRPKVPTVVPKVSGRAVALLFEARCAGCHRPGVFAGGVDLFDREALIRDGRLTPGYSSRSPLLSLVAGDQAGRPTPDHPRYAPDEESAIREWIDAGAPGLDRPVGPIPPRTPAGSDFSWGEYTRRAILADVMKLPEPQRAMVRYFSLDHLAAAGADEGELNRGRKTFTRAIADLAVPGKSPTPKGVDPASLVYRVDLRDLGWDDTPLRLAPPGSSRGLDLFDLVLLEYPYGLIPDASPSFDRLRDGWMTPSGLVRPIHSVRADWFAFAIRDTPLRPEIAALTRGRAPSGPTTFDYPLESVSRERAAAELGRSASMLLGLESGGQFPRVGLVADQWKGGVSRRVLWESVFLSFADRLKLGTPLEPIDGLYATPGDEGRPRPKIRLTTNHPDNRFTLGDRLTITATNLSDEAVFVEIFGRSITGQAVNVLKQIVTVPARGEFRYPPTGKEKILKGLPGTERFELYSSFEPFEGGRVYRSGRVADRIVHPTGSTRRLHRQTLDITTTEAPAR